MQSTQRVRVQKETNVGRRQKEQNLVGVRNLQWRRAGRTGAHFSGGKLFARLYHPDSTMITYTSLGRRPLLYGAVHDYRSPWDSSGVHAIRSGKKQGTVTVQERYRNVRTASRLAARY